MIEELSTNDQGDATYQDGNAEKTEDKLGPCGIKQLASPFSEPFGVPL